MARKTGLDRRIILGGLALAALPLGRPRAATVPLRIGLLSIRTGPLADGGANMEQGITVFLKERGQKLAGRPVELTIVDTAGKPDGAKARVEELIERVHAEIVLGPLAAYEVLAINDYVLRAKVPLLSMAAAEDITQRKPNPWFLRTSSSSGQAAHPMAHYAATILKYKRMITMADDFAYGYEQVGAFQRVFEDNGGRIVKKIWTPLGTADYTPFLAQVEGVDAVFSGFGGTAVRFTRQYSDFGLKDKFPLVGGQTSMDDSHLHNMGDDAVGVMSCNSYTASVDTPSNHRFVAGMSQEYGLVPGTYAASTYMDGQCIEAALGKTGRRSGDTRALMAAMRAVKLTDTPRGPLEFDHFGNAVGNFFILRCERENGKLVNKIVKIYEHVSQFWTYDEKWFLAQPVYSRNYPELKTN